MEGKRIYTKNLTLSMGGKTSMEGKTIYIKILTLQPEGKTH